MSLKNLLRGFTSFLNPFCKTKSVSLRNGDLGASSSHFFSTGTAITEPYNPSHRVQQDTLSRRLMGGDTNPKKPLSQILKQWVDEGREVDLRDVRNSIEQYRDSGHYDHALEISKWVGCTSNSNLTNGNAAMHLDLIYKVHGLEQAEKYFESTPDDLKVFHLYGALLNCYVNEKLLDQAEAIMQKMRELGYDECVSYNGVLNLFSRKGEWIKIISLVQEMENKGINFDFGTYNILLNAYASTGDMLGMERLLMKMEADPLVVMNWMPYSISANGYLKAGDITKAASMLKKCEQMIIDGEKSGPKIHKISPDVYDVLMTMYASIGSKDDVYRIWKLHKTHNKLPNRTYTCMISCLLKLDDTAGAQKLLKKWFSEMVSFDIRIPNTLLAAFCKKGQMEEAESIVNNRLARGEEPSARTFHYMASGYCKKNQMENAVKMTKKGLHKNPRRRPDIRILASCFEFLKGKGDNDEAEEILGLLEDGGTFNGDFKDLISEYKRTGDPSVLVSDGERVRHRGRETVRLG